LPEFFPESYCGSALESGTEANGQAAVPELRIMPTARLMMFTKQKLPQPLAQQENLQQVESKQDQSDRG
jgi:hypothetical protein